MWQGRMFVTDRKKCFQRTESVYTCIAVGTAGMIGALLRYFCGWWMGTADGFPFGTLFVNMTGSFVLSVFSFTASRCKRIPSWFSAGISSGLIGSYTTFSAVSMETAELFRAQRWADGAGYVLLSLWGGLLMVWLGDRTSAVLAAAATKRRRR